MAGREERKETGKGWRGLEGKGVANESSHFSERPDASDSSSHISRHNL